MVLPAGTESDYFSEADCATPDLAEAIAIVADGHVSDADYDAASNVLTADQLSAVSWLTSVTNGFNRVAITTRYHVVP